MENSSMESFNRKDTHQLKVLLRDVSEQLSQHDCNQGDIRDTLNNFTFSVTNKLRLMERQMSSMTRVIQNSLDEIEERVNKCVKSVSKLTDPNNTSITKKRKFNFLDDLSEHESYEASNNEASEEEFDIEEVSIVTQTWKSPKETSSKKNTSKLKAKRYDTNMVSCSSFPITFEYYINQFFSLQTVATVLLSLNRSFRKKNMWEMIKCLCL